MNIEQAQLLSHKLDKLNEFFDITTSTVDELTEFIDDEEEIEILEDEDENEIVSLKTLKEDFTFIRKTLLETVDNGKKVINKLSLDIEINENASGQVISAYADLVGTVNNSLKLLTSTYKDIVEMNVKLNKKDTKPSKISVDGDVKVTNIISGNINDIVSAIRENNK